MEMINSLARNIFNNMYIVIIFYIVLGSLFEKKSLTNIINSILKTLMAVFIMEIGISVLNSSMANLNYIIPRAFRVIGIIPQNEGAAALGEFRYKEVINNIIFLGMIVNLLMAKFSRFKYIFLTGQQIIFMGSMLGIILVPLNFNYINSVLIGGIILGVLMSVIPAIIKDESQEIIKNKKITVGHFSTLFFFLSIKLSSFLVKINEDNKFKFNKKNKIKTKELYNNKIDKNFSMFLDASIMSALFMIVIFILSAVFAKKEYVQEISGDSNYLIFAFKQGFLFACGIHIVLNGVRMFIQEIIPAFKGIAKKFVPDAVLALDVSILFPRNESILISSFIMSFLGGILAMILTSFYNFMVVLPAAMIHFFTGGGCGIYANSKGNKKISLFVSFVMGFLINLFPLILISHYKEIHFSRMVFAESDITFVGFILRFIIKLFK